MNTKKIQKDEISDITVASLPSRPTAPTAFGGRGYTSKEMKEAFDRLPLFIIERFNSLLDDIDSADEDSLLAAIPTGIKAEHTLRSFFFDVMSGAVCDYIGFADTNLAAMIRDLIEKDNEISDGLEVCFLHLTDKIMDGARPGARNRESGEVIS